MIKREISYNLIKFKLKNENQITFSDLFRSFPPSLFPIDSAFPLTFFVRNFLLFFFTEKFSTHAIIVLQEKQNLFSLFTKYVQLSQNCIETR